MGEGGVHLLEERLRLDDLGHEFADDLVGLLADALPAVAEPVHHRPRHRVQVGLEGDAQTVDQQPANVQAVLGDLKQKEKTRENENFKRINSKRGKKIFLDLDIFVFEGRLHWTRFNAAMGGGPIAIASMYDISRPHVSIVGA